MKDIIKNKKRTLWKGYTMKKTFTHKLDDHTKTASWAQRSPTATKPNERQSKGRYIRQILR